jgi:polyhydroxyalkanoate synthase subunit PhaC
MLANTKAQVEVKTPTTTLSVSRYNLDRLMRSSIMRATLGRSPLSLLNAYTAWLGHLMVAPGLQQQLFQLAVERSVQIGQYAANCALRGRAPEEPCISPLPQDKRFADPTWSEWPFSVIRQIFLMQQDWWEQATTLVPGVSPHNAREVSFLARQVLDQFAPTNFVAT